MLKKTKIAIAGVGTVGSGVIELFKNRRKVLIPFVKEIVPLVDVKNNYLIINPPNGLLEL